MTNKDGFRFKIGDKLKSIMTGKIGIIEDLKITRSSPYYIVNFGDDEKNKQVVFDDLIVDW